MDEDHHVTTNFIEIARDGEQLTFYIFVEALGGYQAVVRRSLSHRHIKLFLKTNRQNGGYYDRIRFMIYDPEHNVSNEHLSIHWYDLPEMQRIESVGVALTLATGSNDRGELQSEQVGFDHFMAYGEWDVPEKLKNNFEWNPGKVGTIPGLSIVSHHSEYYRSPTKVDLRLSKEYIHFCL